MLLYLLLMIVSFGSAVACSIIFYNWHITATNALSTITRYPVLLSPTHVIYMIVFILYAFMAYWIWQQYKHQHTLYQKRALYFSLAMVIQALLYIAWHKENLTYMLLLQVLLIAIAYLLYRTYPKRDYQWTGRLPLSLYFGWSSVSLLFILEFIFVYHNFHGFGLSRPFWAIGLLTLGAIMALYIRYRYDDIAFIIPFILNYIGIAIHLKFDEMLVTAVTLFLTGSMLVGMMYFQPKQQE